MRTLQLARRFVAHDWGGTETVIVETSRRLQERGHRVDIATSSALSRVGRESVAGLEVQRFPYFYPFLGLDSDTRRALDAKGGNMFSFELLRDLRAREDLDLIHCHTGKRFGAIGRCAARRLGIPYVVSLHGGFFDVPREQEQRLLEPTRGHWEWGKVLGWAVGSRRLLADADVVICVGEEECRRVRERLPGARVEWLPNGVDSRRFADGVGARFRARHEIPKERRVLLCVGRIDPQKNQIFLLRLLREQLRAGRDDHLVLIGHVTDMGYRDRLLREASELGLTSRLTLVEGLPAASQILVDAFHAADWFLLPSLHEPFGIVVLEAWAAGLPVIASRVGGVPSFVRSGHNGVLLEAGDLHAWSRALAAQDGILPRSVPIRRQGLQDARNRFDWEVITSRLEALYQEIVVAHRSSRKEVA
jgi:glycosyltransferase involved in cell wall biosynthesis